jgi:predicted cobalt transporter CbtA
MGTQQILAVAGAASGALGSIVTAFSLSSVLRELNIARGFLEVTVSAIATQSRAIPVFEGLEKRHHRATKWSNVVLWFGVALLVGGFVLQAMSILWGSGAGGD